MNPLQKALNLCRPRNVALFLAILAHLPRVRALLEREELPIVLRQLDVCRGRARQPEQEDIQWAIVGRTYLNLILIHLLRKKNPCLLRSLSLFHLLRKRGLDVHVHFGVDKDSAPFAGHCWLSSGGQPFLEFTDPSATYVDIYSYPGRPL